MAAACSSSGPSAAERRQAAELAMQARLAPKAHAACARFGAAHSLRGGAAEAAGTAADVVAIQQLQHMDPAPWDHVDPHENVYLCSLERSKKCKRWGPIVVSMQRFIDDAGRSSRSVPEADPQPSPCAA